MTWDDIDALRADLAAGLRLAFGPRRFWLRRLTVYCLAATMLYLSVAAVAELLS